MGASVQRWPSWCSISLGLGLGCCGQAAFQYVCLASPASSGAIPMPSDPRCVSHMGLTSFLTSSVSPRNSSAGGCVRCADLPLPDLHTLCNSERQLPWVSRKECLPVALVISSLLQISEDGSVFLPSGPPEGSCPSI